VRVALAVPRARRVLDPPHGSHAFCTAQPHLRSVEVELGAAGSTFENLADGAMKLGRYLAVEPHLNGAQTGRPDAHP